MRKRKLLSRLKHLYVLELVNSIFMPAAAIWISNIINEPVGLNAMLAMTLNGVILLEGSYFWFAVSRQLQKKRQMDFRGTFRNLRNLNIGLIAIAAIAISANPFAGGFDKMVTSVFLVLAILEHVNYFEIQLMYDNRNDLSYLVRYRRLKKAKLKRAVWSEPCTNS